MMENRVLRTTLYRPIWLPAMITAVLLLVALGLLVGSAWRNLERLHPVHHHLTLLSHLQETGLRLEVMLVNQLSDNTAVDMEKLTLMRKEIADIMALDTHLVADTPQHLQEARKALADLAQNPREALIVSLASIRHVLAVETQANDVLVAGVRRDTEFEFRIAAATLIILPLVAFVTMFLLRKRIFEPLNELGSLMALLARQDYNPAPSDVVDPVLKPLFDNYNHLVSRLTELEQLNLARRQSLENQVRTATHALLGQQRELADAERLAAVGEVAAGLAHELRNPLAGMQMALNNLRQETDDQDHAERLALVVNELNRITGLLNGLLSQTQQEVETSVVVQLAPAIKDLVTLAGYQIGVNIQLVQEIPSHLVCRLPAGRLHQALLNLVLNAAQAIGDGDSRIVIRGDQQDGELTLSVCDDGPGFSQALLDSGIRPFVTGRTGGTGLGLAIVQRFTRDMGGKIRLSNREPRGACVTLTLPCKGNHG